MDQTLVDHNIREELNIDQNHLIKKRDIQLS